MTTRWNPIRAFIDPGDRGVAHHPLDREVRAGVIQGRRRGSVVTSIATSDAKRFDADELKPRQAPHRRATTPQTQAHQGRRPPVPNRGRTRRQSAQQRSRQ
jgi:hypothetical protein